MKKFSNILIAGVLTAFSLTSCERDLTSLNEDPKHPSVLQSKSLLATGQYQSSYYMFTGSVNFNNYRFFVQQWAETTYIDETNYDLVTRNQPRNHWNRMYVYSLNNFEQAKKNLATEANDEPIQNNKWATLEISQLFVWENIVDTYGDVPYFNALNAAEGQFAPKYDDAKAIYTDLLSRIDGAIAKIDESDSGYNDGDLIYAGNMTKWKHFANSIKLRLAMNLADVDPAASKAAAESAIASGVISSADESYVFNFDRGTFTNPIFDDLVASGRNDFVPSALVINTMKTNSDPRLDVWFTKVDGEFVGGTFGSKNPFGSRSHMKDFFLGKDAPANLLSYSEVLFMEAEAAARGYNVGDSAESFYNQAITASMLDNGLSSGAATTYLTANAYDSVNWQKSIGTQAWVSLFNRGFAAWNFSRRLDYPAFVNPPNSKTEGVPVRMPYSDQEYVLNGTNVNAAASKIGGDKANTKIFWDIH